MTLMNGMTAEEVRANNNAADSIWAGVADLDFVIIDDVRYVKALDVFDVTRRHIVR